jgi:hypothetical protein
MKQMKSYLTSEELSKKFINPFDLVNYAIRLADNTLKSGRPPRVNVDTDNLAVQILEEIEAGKDKFEDIPVHEETSTEVITTVSTAEKNGFRRESHSNYSDERSKRKILSE